MATRESCREVPEPCLARLASECLIGSPHLPPNAGKGPGEGVVILQPAAPHRCLSRFPAQAATRHESARQPETEQNNYLSATCGAGCGIAEFRGIPLTDEGAAVRLACRQA